MSRWREGAPFKVGLSGFREWQPEETKEKTAEKGLAAETAAQNEVREAAAVQPEQNSRMAVKGMAQGKQGEAAAAQPEQKEQTPAQDVPSGSRVETAAAGEETEAIHVTELPMRNLFPEYDWNAVWEELCREHKPAALFEEWDTQCIQLELKDLRSLPKNTGIWETTAFCYMDFSIIGIWCLAGRRRNGGSLACREYIRDRSA